MNFCVFKIYQPENVCTFFQDKSHTCSYKEQRRGREKWGKSEKGWTFYSSWSKNDNKAQFNQNSWFKRNCNCCTYCVFRFIKSVCNSTHLESRLKSFSRKSAIFYCTCVTFLTQHRRCIIIQRELKVHEYVSSKSARKKSSRVETRQSRDRVIEISLIAGQFASSVTCARSSYDAPRFRESRSSRANFDGQGSQVAGFYDERSFRYINRFVR